MSHFPDAAALPVGIKAGPSEILTKRLLSRNAGGPRSVERPNILIIRLYDVPLGQRFTQTGRVDGRAVQVQQVTARKLTQDGHHAAGTMHVFHVVERRARCDFAQLRNFA